MPVETNAFSPSTPESTQENQKQHTNFSGVDLGLGGAPAGSMDFLNVVNRLGLGQIESAVKPYLDNVTKLVKDNLPNVTLIKLTRSTNTYAYRFDGPDGTANFFGIIFVNPHDLPTPSFIPPSHRITALQQELKDNFSPNQPIRLVDVRVILAGYEPDMQRFEYMANCIVRFFQVTSIPEIKNATISLLKSTEFVASWSLHEARNAERQLSPHGVPPRMEVGLTLKAKISNNYGSRELREFETDYTLLGVIGGYVEFREREIVYINNQRIEMFRPVFNITVLNSVIPLEGVGAILMAAFLPNIYNSLVWGKQFIELGDGHPNPGMLLEDPQNRGRPMLVRDQEELKDFLTNMCTQPTVVYQVLDGADNIPNMWRLVSESGDHHRHFISRIANFFNSSEEQIIPSRVVERRHEGVYGDPSGILKDSRDIDYLYFVNKNGFASITPDVRRVLLGTNVAAVDRARLVQSVTNSFTPTNLNNLALINPDFVGWIARQVQAHNLTVTDPEHRTETRPLGSYLSGFGDPSTLNSIITNIPGARGLNLNSAWNFS